MIREIVSAYLLVYGTNVFLQKKMLPHKKLQSSLDGCAASAGYIQGMVCEGGGWHIFVDTSERMYTLIDLFDKRTEFFIVNTQVYNA